MLAGPSTPSTACAAVFHDEDEASASVGVSASGPTVPREVITGARPSISRPSVSTDEMDGNEDPLDKPGSVGEETGIARTITLCVFVCPLSLIGKLWRTARCFSWIGGESDGSWTWGS
jgi:hypothetical protein